ncbi:hypothetical protein FRB95_014501 [Tulasnella sp. JGI-2019a]|nr:hypothetical protein FRB95_014501 [Tulasnella sp. JGI-2019a]
MSLHSLFKAGLNSCKGSTSSTYDISSTSVCQSHLVPGWGTTISVQPPSNDFSPPPSPGIRSPLPSVSTTEDSKRLGKEGKVNPNQQYARTACWTIGLPEALLKEFAELTDAEMLITIRASMLKTKLLQAFATYVTLLSSSAFGNSLVDHITTCLNSPKLYMYKDGTANHIMKVIQMYPSHFGVSDGLLNHGPSWNTLWKMVQDMSMHTWSSIKSRQHFQGVITANGIPSVRFAPALPSRGPKSPGSIWQTHLREFLDAHKPKASRAVSASIDEEGEENSGSHNTPEDSNSMPKYNLTQFWDYVDSQLCQVREDCRAVPEERAGFITHIYTQNMQGDLIMYPAPDGGVHEYFKENPMLPDWQHDIEAAMALPTPGNT